MKRALTLTSLVTVLTLLIGAPPTALSQRKAVRDPYLRLVNVVGYVELEGLSRSAPKQSVTISIALPDRTYSYHTDVQGKNRCHFYMPEGVYIATIQGEKWLSRKVLIDSRKPNNACNVVLLGGDADGDNAVDWPDMDILAAAYQTHKNDSAYDERADFDCDGDVDDADADILFYNLFQRGE